MATRLNYAIVGGADRFKFDIDKTTGALTFKSVPDFENPTDTDENGSDSRRTQHLHRDRARL